MVLEQAKAGGDGEMDEWIYMCWCVWVWVLKHYQVLNLCGRNTLIILYEDSLCM